MINVEAFDRLHGKTVARVYVIVYDGATNGFPAKISITFTDGSSMIVHADQSGRVELYA